MFNNWDPPPQQLVPTFFFFVLGQKIIIIFFYLLRLFLISLAPFPQSSACRLSGSMEIIPSCQPLPRCSKLPCLWNLPHCCLCLALGTTWWSMSSKEMKKSLFSTFLFFYRCLQTFQQPKLNLMFLASGCESVTTSWGNNDKTYSWYRDKY